MITLILVTVYKMKWDRHSFLNRQDIFENGGQCMATDIALIIPIGVCYYLELRNAITSWLGVQFLLMKAQ